MGQSRLRKAASSKPGLLDEITTVGTRCSLCQQHAIGPRLIPRRTFKGALSIQAVSCCHRMGGSIWCRTPRSDKQIQTVVALVTSVWCQVREPYAPALSSASHPDPCIVRTGIKRWTAACSFIWRIEPTKKKGRMLSHGPIQYNPTGGNAYSMLAVSLPFKAFCTKRIGRQGGSGLFDPRTAGIPIKGQRSHDARMLLRRQSDKV
jgi:hypothetical protein